MNKNCFLTEKRRLSDEIWTSAEEYYSSFQNSMVDENRAVLMLMQYIDTLKMMYQEMAQEFSLVDPDIEITPDWIEIFYGRLMLAVKRYCGSTATSHINNLIQIQYDVCEKYYFEYKNLIDSFEMTLTKGVDNHD